MLANYETELDTPKGSFFFNVIVTCKPLSKIFPKT